MSLNAPNKKIITTDYLNEQDLTKLFNDEICIIQVKQFCESVLCDRLSIWFKSSDRLAEYPYVMKRQDSVKTIYFGVDRVGIPYNSTYGDSAQKEKYYAEAMSGIRALRAASYPGLSPIDRLRVELDENWVPGANLANFEGKKMFVGIGRVMKPELSQMSEYQPHWDSVPTQYANLLGQFSANVYLAVPDEGGELEIWDIEPLPTSIIHHNDPERDWRAELPPSIRLKPDKGDLLLFNTRRPHAITRFDGATRVAAQCFIGINPDKSLSMWT
jgi:hypothetical protein